ncbi:hypothetical protein [Nocardia gipuzkoensis]|uniref:hypothetical protein n=1 Tax=Nocardia gipuzkoensis TaxID=2749991 RepID=UPI003EE30F34
MGFGVDGRAVGFEPWRGQCLNGQRDVAGELRMRFRVDGRRVWIEPRSGRCLRTALGQREVAGEGRGWGA